MMQMIDLTIFDMESEFAWEREYGAQDSCLIIYWNR